MTLSIIIPMHNGEKFIKRCLDSLMRQTVLVDEVIIVNDHSTDNSKELCIEYCNKYNNVIYVEAEKCGVSAARNTGLNIATGDIIGFCDIDDLKIMNMAEVVKKTYEKNPFLKIVISGYQKVDSEDISQILGDYTCSNTDHWKKKDYLKHTIYDENIFGLVTNKYFSSNLIHNVKFDESLSLCEDMDFVLRAMLLCNENEIKVIDSITYQYSFNLNSVTNDETKLFSEGHSELKYNEAFFKMANNEELSTDIKEYLYYKAFCFSVAIVSYYDVNDKREYLLKKHIRELYPLYIKFFWLEPVSNFKRGIKCLFRIRRGRLFRW